MIICDFCKKELDDRSKPFRFGTTYQGVAVDINVGSLTDMGLESAPIDSCIDCLVQVLVKGSTEFLNIMRDL